MRVLTLLAAAILGVAASLLVACGGGDKSKLIPAADAGQLRSALDEVASATQSGDCTAAQAAVTRASSVLAGLPDEVDARLRSRLRSGVANLRARVPVQCAEQTETTPTQTQTAPAQTQTTPTQTQTTPTQTQTTPTTTTPTTTTPAPTTPTTPESTGSSGNGSGGTGGTGNGNGGANADGNGNGGGSGNGTGGASAGGDAR
jgi:hypothetical protein